MKSIGHASEFMVVLWEKKGDRLFLVWDFSLEPKKGDAMFRPHDKVVYPGYGVAIIDRVVVKKIGGHAASFFELRFLHKDMTILVPVENAHAVGLRCLSSQDYINTIFLQLSQPAIQDYPEALAANWNKRSKRYREMIQTGNLVQICTIYKDLKYIEKHKELSFGEKNLLQQTESLLAQEIAIVKEMGEEKAVQHVRLLVHHQVSR